MTAVLTRREFLACPPLLLLARRTPIRLSLRGCSSERRGASMALEEMGQTASLLGRAIDRADHPGAVVVDCAAHTIAAGGAVFHLAASGESREAALREWAASHAGGAAAAALEWHPALTRFGAEQLNQRFERRFAARMTSAEWLDWIAIKIAVDAQLRSVPVGKGRYDGHKGTALYFAGNLLVQPLCIVDESGALLGLSPPG